MRGVRSFVGLLVVLIALGAYLYFVDAKRPASDEGDKKDKVFGVEASAIDELTIKSESGERTALKKSGSDWQIVQPVTAKPDAAEVSGITTNLASLEVQRVIDESPQDLVEYNLASPRVEVSFKAGGQQHTLLIGRKTPPGTDLYAKLADQKKVFLISSYLDSTFNRTTFDLRDKTVLAINRDEIGSLAITTPTGSMRFEKSAVEWKMTQPVAARADFSAVDGLVSRLTTLQMKSIVSPDASKAADYGLDKPQATVNVGSGSSHAVLTIGKASGEGAVYARDQSRPIVFTIDSALLDDLKKQPGDYRQKDLFDARAFNANRIELTRNGQTTAFEKTKGKNKQGQDEETWKQVAPSAKEVDQAKVDNLLSSVTQARASSFVETAPKGVLDKPELTVSIVSSEGKHQEKVAFGRSGPDVYASRGTDPGVAKLDAATLDGIVKALEEIK
jgi:uncharacterized protein DUF4340